MYGTATGILGSLPSFTRAVEVVHAVNRISNLQYIMCAPKLREFADSILVGMKCNERRDVIKLQL